MLRASVRIGELVRELDNAEAHGGQICLPTAGKTKGDAIADAAGAALRGSVPAPLTLPGFHAPTGGKLKADAERRMGPHLSQVELAKGGQPFQARSTGRAD